MNRILRHIILVIVCIAGFCVNASAQFKEEAFTQTYADPADSTAVSDTSAGMFSFKELFRGTAHKQDLRMGVMVTGSVFLPGISQVYNRDYWKLPVIYTGMGACTGFGIYYMRKYNSSKRAYDAAFALDPTTTVTKNNSAKTAGTCLLIGAGLFYWGSLMDGVINYKRDQHIRPDPSRATAYSLLLPGLGQAYNGEYWKIPIYWGCLIGSAHYYYQNRDNYRRFRRIYNEASQDGYTGSISASTAQYYRNVYRRYRDYSVVAFLAFYILQVIDANVFAYMYDFEVNDDISMSLEPALIEPDNAYALQCSPRGMTTSAIGLRLGITF